MFPEYEDEQKTAWSLRMFCILLPEYDEHKMACS